MSVFMPALHSLALPGKTLQTVSCLGVCLDYVTDVSRAAYGRRYHSLGWDPGPSKSGSNELSPGTPGLVLSALHCGCDQ